MKANKDSASPLSLWVIGLSGLILEVLVLKPLFLGLQTDVRTNLFLRFPLSVVRVVVVEGIGKLSFLSSSKEKGLVWMVTNKK